MRRVAFLPVLLLACTGPVEPTDSDLPLGCELSTNADTFDANAGAGRDITVTLTVEARCREAFTLNVSWREPQSGAWSLPESLQTTPSLTLQPYEPQDIGVVFAPETAGNFDDRLVLESDNAQVGGVILRFRGVGE